MNFHLGVQEARPFGARPGKEVHLGMRFRDRHAIPDWRTGTGADETWGRAGSEGLFLLPIREVFL
jgi:hypothetical protein